MVCVVPQHLEEGQEIELEKPELELALGQPVTFPLYTSTVRSDDRAGDVLTVAPDQLLQMPPLHTILRGGKRSGAKHVPVTLAARSTAIGTLELFCVAKEGGNRWRLEFNIRDLVKPPPAGEPGASTPGDDGAAALTDVWPEAQVQEAARLIREVYVGRERDDAAGVDQGAGGGAGRPAARLADRVVPAAVGVPVGGRGRAAPFAGPSGALVQPGRLLPAARLRRPDGPVPHRTALEDDGGPAAAGVGRASPEGGADFWILWRRVAGGLNPTLQRSLYDRLRPVLLPGKGKAGARAEPERTGRNVAGRGEPGTDST